MIDFAPAAAPRSPLADLRAGVRRWVLTPLADLRITVVLLAFSTFLVLAGTLAQVNADIWEVVHGYFRCWLAYVPLRDLVPVTWFPDAGNPSGGFWFPGGWTLGLCLGINQLASMATKFKVKATGAALWGGLAVTAIGVAVTWAVVVSGMSAEGLQGDPLLDWGVLWNVFRFALIAAGGFASALSLRRLLDAEKRKEPATVLLTASAVGGVVLAVWSIWQGAVSDSSVRILWQLMKATLAAGILLAGLLPIFGRQGGTFLLHCGLLLLLASEFHTGTYAREAVMVLSEGGKANYLSDTRDYEFALVTRNADGTETHAVVAADRLRAAARAGEPIDDPRLPVVVEPLSLFDNADAVAVGSPGALPNPPDVLNGDAAVKPLAGGTGVVNGSADYPGGLFRLRTRDGAALGTVVGSPFVKAPAVEIDGKSVRPELRFTREYLPFTVTLDDVTAGFYPGTTTPSEYRSALAVAPTGGERFEAFTWMNNPLRYAGRTFYQSGYSPARGGRPETSTLQVVTNTGWMVPYVACMILAVGMLAQFTMSLTRFLARRGPAPVDRNLPVDAPDPREEPTTRLGWAFPLAVVLVFGGYAASKWRPPAPTAEGLDLAAFEAIPVLHGGRFKPIGTVARNALKGLNGNRQTFSVGEPYPVMGLSFWTKRKSEPAARWLLDTVVDPRVGADAEVFRITNPQVLATLKLEPRPGLTYALSEFFSPDLLDVVAERSREAAELRETKQPVSADLRAFEELGSKLSVLLTLTQSLDPAGMAASARSLPDYMRAYDRLWSGNQAPLTVPRGPRWETLTHAANQERQEEEILAELKQAGLSAAELLDALPDTGGPIPGLKAFLTAEEFDGDPDPVLDAWQNLRAAYARGEATKFNAAVKRVTDRVVAAEAERRDRYPAAASEAPLSPGRVRLEAWFNQAAPLFSCYVLYIVATALTLVGWALVPLAWGTPPRRAATWLLLFTFAVHTVGLAARIYISGRPPVTNLYSSAVFIGWGAVGLGLLLERLYGWGVGNAVACVGGVGTLLIAHSEPLSGGDTFTVMQAVLDTQFWLATHVVTITLGYAATGAAGLLGVFYVLGGLFTKTLRTDVGRAGTRSAGQSLGSALGRMIYGIVCFAALLSLVGTILGGLWADDSWGRFWGWDPKENGAMLIVIWNALLLHARWGKLVADRGVALLAVAGNVAVAWSWFGVNELGEGLHSYGFTEGVLWTLGWVVALHLAVIAAGALTPARFWRSFRESPPA